jgi:hypothetical protein
MRVVALLALAAIASAHWTHDDSLAYEIGPPPGETMPEGHVENPLTLAAIEEGEATDPAIVYRVTTGTIDATKEAAATNSPWSTHMFQMNIEGSTGVKTGLKLLRYYAPTLSYGQASGAAGSMAAEFHPGMNPKECEANTGDCAKVLNGPGATWEGVPGIIQHAQIESSEKVGEIKKITLMEQTAGLKETEYDGWQPSFIKVNANDAKTGLGAGVYYIDPAKKEIRGVVPFVAELPAADGSVPSGKVALTKCKAQFCEEEMDQRMGIEAVKA